MKIHTALIALGIAGFALNAHAVTNPVVACATTALYANVTDPIKLAFAPDGTLYVGRDNIGSGGGSSDAVKIHRVAPGGSPVTEYGSVAVADPDAVGFDALGLVSGTPGAVLVGGSTTGLGATISKINTNGVVTTLFGGVLTNMNNPGELLFDAAGRLYISDFESNRVYATSSAAAPTNLLSMAGAYAMAFDVSNRLAVGSRSVGALQLYSTNGQFLASSAAIKAGAPVVAGPGDAFWGRELYSVSTSDQLIRIDTFGNAVVVGSGFDGRLQMAFGPDHALYVSYPDHDVILRIAPPTVPGMEVGLFADVTDPQTLSFAPDGTLYTGRDNSGSGGTSADAVKINRVGSCGTPVTEFGNTNILDPDAVAYDAAGIVSGLPGSVLVGGVTGASLGQIARIAPDGTVTNLFGPNSVVQNPVKFTFANPGRLFFADNATETVMVMTNPMPQMFFATPAPYSLALDGLGRVLVSSTTTNQVRLYGTAGELLSNAFVTAQVRSPLARGPGGVWGTDVYFVATNGNLRSVSPAGVVTEHGTGFSPFEDMEFGPDGALYLSDLHSDCVLRVTPPGYLPVPAHWWRGDGNATNSTGTEHGTASGSLTYAPGRFGEAFSFDGTFNSQLTFGTNAGNFGTGDFTIGLWIKTATSNTLNIQFLVKRAFCNHENFWSLAMAGSPYIELDQDFAGNNYFAVGAALPAQAQVADAQWHHIAFVRRGGEGFLYRDAVLVGSKATNFVTHLSNAALLTANSGICQAFGTAPLNGLLDEIKFYGCALSAAQIAASAGTPDPNLPSLGIESLPGAVRLSWPANAAGYLLETNSALTFPAGWGVLTSNYNILSTYYVVTNTIGGATRFYRLHKP